MSKSYLDYAMSVIVSRAIPDVRDGLKPVQRRTLYSMHELGVKHDKPHRKSARIVGDTMGKYHPHGDSSIYEALVVMAQDWKKEEILVDGHGNFGSIEGDGAAAARYTEARLSELSETAFLADLDKDVVDFVPNFDETEKEPVVLPVRVPNLLINGADGIAVGMKTSIPTHNLREVTEAMKLLLTCPDADVDELMEVMPGPDFPTGGIIINKKDLRNIYETGMGKVRLRGRITLEPGKRKSDKSSLVVTEIPYTMIGSGISKFISDVAALMEGKKLPEVTDISNQSSKEGIRIVFELKNGADPERVKNILYKKTGLEDTFGVNMLTIVGGIPRTVGLKEILQENIEFQRELNTRKFRNLLEKEKIKSEIQEGLIRAIDMIDLIIEIIRGSKTVKDAKACLMGDPSNVTFRSPQSAMAAQNLDFTERQATAIMEMRLAKLIGLEIISLEQEHEKTLKLISQYEKLLNSSRAMTQAIIRDLNGYIEKFGKNRCTEITDEEAAPEVKEEVVEQEFMFAIDRFGYIKTYDLSVFHRNEENIRNDNRRVFPCRNTGKICVFTDTGKMHQLKVSDIPMVRAKDKGVPLDTLCPLDHKEENVVGIFADHDLEQEKYLFVTEGGQVKIVKGSEFIAGRKTIAATKLNDGDRLAAVQLLTDTQVILRTKANYVIRFAVSEISEMKRASTGVRGMQLTEGDQVCEVYQVSPRMKTDTRKEEGDSTAIDWNQVKLSRRGAKGVRQRKQ
ncbi:MAG: DNA topoisomerase 4 subunit A [Clostridiales bacterium]|nr:DNA topoisomerase 4 subunit A [Clostridiales bacterium]